MMTNRRVRIKCKSDVPMQQQVVLLVLLSCWRCMATPLSIRLTVNFDRGCNKQMSFDIHCAAAHIFISVKLRDFGSSFRRLWHLVYAVAFDSIQRI